MKYCKTSIFICFFILSSIQALAQIYIDSPPCNVLTIPIRLDKVSEIEGFDIYLKTNPTEIELKGVNLVGGILEPDNNSIYYGLNLNQFQDGRISIGIPALGSNLITDKGIIAFLNFSFIGDITKTVITIEKIYCNAISCMKEAGFVLENSIVHKIDISISNKIDLKEVIQSLQIQAGLIQKKSVQCINDLSGIIYILQTLTGINKQDIQHKESKKKKSVSLINNNNLRIPIVINEKKEIEAIECTIEYNESFLDVSDVNLKGSLLENNNYILFYNDTIKGKIKLWIYAHQNLLFQKGEIAFIEFSFFKKTCKPIDISLVSLKCNNKQIDGGFLVDDLTYKTISLKSESCSYFISASSGIGGEIYPSGKITVEDGLDQNFKIIPENDYIIDNVIVDNIKSLGSIDNYTFTNIVQDHSIYVIFKKKPELKINKPIPDVIVKEDSDNTYINLDDVFKVFNVDENIPLTKSICLNSNGELLTSTINNNNLILHYNKNQFGEARINICTAYNEQNIKDEFKVKVIPINDPPNISNISNQTIGINSSINLNFQVSDIDTSTRNLKVYSFSSNKALIPNNNKHISFGGYNNERFVNISPVSGKYGSSNITIFVSDGKNKVSTNFNLTVNNIEYTITAFIGENGQINHPDKVVLHKNENIKYRIIPYKGFKVDNVIVDGRSLGYLNYYIFRAISDNHSLSVTFKEIEKYTITTIAETGGQIYPEGEFVIPEGKEKLFKINPFSGYIIKDVLIDNESTGVINKYLFKNIEESHTIKALFESVDPPEADFIQNVLSGTAPLTVKFKDKSKNKISTWYWDFGDGFNSSLPDPWHTYTSPGDYTVTLKVTSSGGQDKKIGFITVNFDYIDFTSSVKTGNAPLSVSFADTSEGYTILSWNFGDGYTENIQKPLHIYTNPGNYTVSVVAISNGEKLTKISKNFIIVRGRTINGRVTAADSGKGLSNSLLEVWESKSSLKGMSLTDVDGYYTLTNLPASSDIMIAVWPSYENSNYIKQFYNNKKSRSSATLLSTISNNLENINFILNKKPENSFQGRIIDEKGQGIPNIKVYTFSDNAKKGNSTTADEFGYYTFTGLEAADYKVYVYSKELKRNVYYAIPDGDLYTQYVPNLTDSMYEEKHATLINPQNPGLKNINIFVNYGGYIKGSVMADNTPVKNIWVKAWSNILKAGNSALTDENGHYTIIGLISDSNSKPVTYIVEIESNDYPYQAYNNATYLANAIGVTTGSTNINFLLKSKYNISGLILDENNIPVPFVDVRAWSVSNPLNKEGMTQTNINGEYTIYNLPPANDYIVSAFSKDYPIQYYNAKYDKNDAKLINLISDDTKNIDFILSKQGIISGIVYIEDNDSLNPAEEGILVNVWSKCIHTEKNTLTDQYGYYEITGLNKYIDDYIIFIKHDDYIPAFYKEEGEENYTTVSSINDATGIAPSDYNKNLVLKKGYTLKGKIIYNDRPVSGVLIEVWSGNTLYNSIFSRKQITNDFNYEITGLEPQSYTIKILSENFKNQTKNLDITNEDKNNFDIILEKLDDKYISGKVLNLSKGKKITILASSRIKNIRKTIYLTGTDSDIFYTINELKPSTDYILELYSNDYPYQVYNRSNKIEDASFIDLSSDNFKDADFVLNLDTSSISGKIEFPTDAIIGEKIRINTSSSTGSNINTIISYAGANPLYYTISKLIKADDYIISINSEKYRTQYYKNALKNNKALLVDIVDQPIKNIDFILSKGTTISGTVYENGNPVEGVEVSAKSQTTGSFGIASTMANGSYIIKGLEYSDDFYIKIKKSGMPPFFLDNGNIVSSISLASNISTLTGNVNNLDIIINQGESISGFVRNSKGQPLSKIKISAWSGTKKIGYNCYTNNHGLYLIEGLAKSNDYKVMVIPDSSMPYTQQEKFDISSNSTEINFILLEGFKIEGTIKDYENNPIEKVKIEIRSLSNGFKTNIKTNYTGKYLLEGLASAEDYEISIYPPESSNLLDIYIKNFVINTDIIKDIILSSGFEITGYIYNNSNTPVPNAFVIAFSDSKNIHKKVETNQDGFYKISNLPDASDYIIKVISDDYTQMQKDNISVASEVDFYLNDAGYIIGSIKDATGIPLQEILVEAYSESLNIRKTALSDANGNFKIVGLKSTQNGYPVADYIITIHPTDYPSQSQNYKKVFDQVNFILSNNELTGIVQDSEGNIPPENITVKILLFKNIERIPCMIKNVNQEGNFKFEGLSSDEEYRLMFSARGSNLLTPKKWASNYYKAGEKIIFKFDETW